MVKFVNKGADEYASSCFHVEFKKDCGALFLPNTRSRMFVALNSRANCGRVSTEDVNG